MPETIESFVAKLKSEGVEQGQLQAEELRDQACQQAQQVAQEAQQQAEKIIADAQAEAENIMARSRTELELAARDAGLKLRESLQRALQAVLAGSVAEQLSDKEFLQALLSDIVTQYVQADVKSQGGVKLNLSPELRSQLGDWSLDKLRQAAQNPDAEVDVQDSLRQGGFEVNISGATVEVTQESVLELMHELVGPSLRGLFDKSMAGGKQ